jgi:ion channel-forming bestrophin family protein
MHVGRSYRLSDFVIWSRRSVIYMAIVSVLAVLAYLLPPLAGFSVPWPIVLVLGTTVSLVTGFKNSQVLSRSTEALTAFTQIAVSSRMLASACCDFLEPDVARRIVYRHLAWLTALRFALRRPVPWETMGRIANKEYRNRRYSLAEDKSSLEAELRALLGDEGARIAAGEQPAAELLHLQGRQFNALLKGEAVPSSIFGELMRVLRDCHDQQVKCERIKNTPYPRQYAIVTTMFVWIFCTMLPFGLVAIVAGMASPGLPLAVAIWLSVPFSILLGWMYLSLDQVGESTSNPFEGNANDVPISQICRDIEIELRTRLGETDLPPRLKPEHGIAT